MLFGFIERAELGKFGGLGLLVNKNETGCIFTAFVSYFRVWLCKIRADHIGFSNKDKTQIPLARQFLMEFLYRNWLTLRTENLLSFAPVESGDVVHQKLIDVMFHGKEGVFQRKFHFDFFLYFFDIVPNILV